MLYVTVFVVATLSALVVLWFVPPRASGVKARLGALEAVGPGLVPIDIPKAHGVQERRREKARRKRQGSRRKHIARLFATSLLLAGVVALLIGGLGPAFTLGISALIGAWAAGIAWIRRSLRLQKVARQLPRGVLIMAHHLRATNSFFGAIEAVAQQAPRTLAQEFARIQERISEGKTEEQAFSSFATRNPVPEVEMLAHALGYSPERGQRLAAALYNLQELMERRGRARAEAARIERSIRLLAWTLVIPAGVLAMAIALRSEALSLANALALGLFSAGTLAINRLCVGVGRG